MTPLIVIECNLIGIKRDFSFLNHELAYSNVCNFLAHSLTELFETSDQIINNAQFVIQKLIILYLRLQTEVY